MLTAFYFSVAVLAAFAHEAWSTKDVLNIMLRVLWLAVMLGCCFLALQHLGYLPMVPTQ